jgi:hypothetical protein
MKRTEEMPGFEDMGKGQPCRTRESFTLIRARRDRLERTENTRYEILTARVRSSGVAPDVGLAGEHLLHHFAHARPGEDHLLSPTARLWRFIQAKYI